MYVNPLIYCLIFLDNLLPFEAFKDEFNLCFHKINGFKHE